MFKFNGNGVQEFFQDDEPEEELPLEAQPTKTASAQNQRKQSSQVQRKIPVTPTATIPTTVISAGFAEFFKGCVDSRLGWVCCGVGMLGAIVQLQGQPWQKEAFALAVAIVLLPMLLWSIFKKNSWLMQWAVQITIAYCAQQVLLLVYVLISNSRA